MQRIFDHIFAYYDSLLPIGSNEITKRLEMWFNNPQCGHKEGEKFPILWWYNHQGTSSHIYSDLEHKSDTWKHYLLQLYTHSVPYSFSKFYGMSTLSRKHGICHRCYPCKILFPLKRFWIETLTNAKKRPLFFNLDCLPRRASKWKMHLLVLVIKFAH